VTRSINDQTIELKGGRALWRTPLRRRSEKAASNTGLVCAFCPALLIQPRAGF